MFGESSRWIWVDRQDTPNRYAEFETEFEGMQGADVQLLISVEGQYAAYVNGQRVPSLQHSDFPFAKEVQSPKVGQWVKEGTNRLLIRCWFPGEDTSVTRKEVPGLRFELTQNGKVIAVSDETVNAREMSEYRQENVPNITGQLGRAFVHRKAAENVWGKAVCVEKETQCVPRRIAELRVEECQKTTLVSQGTFVYTDGEDVGQKMQYAGLFWKDAQKMCGRTKPQFPSEEGVHFESAHGEGMYLLLDMEQLFEGYLTLDITCPEDTQIDMAFGEHVEDLRVRSSIGGRCFGITYTAGPERQAFTHWFRRLGARYLQLFIHGHEVTVYAAGICPAYYPVDEKPYLHIADPLHNRIAEVSRQTLVACMHDHYEDCPWREQALYAFDSRNQMLAGYYAFGEFIFPRENIRLLSHSQREDGLLELCAPARISITIPSFSMAFITELEEYCRYSGDLAFAREILPTCERIVDAFVPYVHDGLIWRLKDPKYWNFYEWQDLLDGHHGFEGDTAEGPLQLFVLLGLQRLGSIRNMLGLEPREVETRMYAELLAGMEKYWNAEEGAYASFLVKGEQKQYAELVQALALYTNICPEERRADLRKRLMNKEFVPITLSYSLFKYEALLQDESYTEPVFREVVQRWGNMLYHGATTFWEVDEGAEAFQRAGSLCHAWSAIPLYLYGAYGLGIRPETPGRWQTHKAYAPLAMQGVLGTPQGYYAVSTNGCGTAAMEKL